MMNRIEAEALLNQILQPVNAGVEAEHHSDFTFEQFVETVYLPVCDRRCKASTAMVEVNRLEYHLVRPLRPKRMQTTSGEEMQALLDAEAEKSGQNMVSHLRFRLRSIFELAMSEGVVDRNPAVALFTPRQCQAGRERLVLSPNKRH